MANKSRWLLEQHARRLSSTFQQRVNKSKSSNDIPAEPSNGEPVTPGYSRISEGLRKKAPSAILCIAFCGGRKCKFDSPDKWPKSDMAIDGLYSHWVTDDILAMARPNAEFIAKRDLVGQFVALGIKTVINLQEPGEHSHCGAPLTQSGFSYMPEVFMSKNIYYYNYSWRDYDNGSLDGLLDAVKVLAFSVTQGKVAVHCHAGLGRTGVLLSCYLVYISRMPANEAINFVRSKRPRAVQTSGQIEMVHEFEQYLANCSSVYCLSVKEFGTTKRRDAESRSVPFSLGQHLDDQRELLHGLEARALKHIPKILYVLCERLLFLCRAADERGATTQRSYSIGDNQSPFTREFYSARFDDEPVRQFAASATADAVQGKSCPAADKKSDGQLLQVPPFHAGQLASGCPKSLSYSEDINWPDDGIAIDCGACATPAPAATRPIDLDAALRSDQTKVARDDVIRSLLAMPEAALLAHPGVREHCVELDGRQSAWARLASERQHETLCALLCYWLLHLEQPLLGNQELSWIVVYANKPDSCLARFDQATRYTIEYLLRFVQRLEPDDRAARSSLLLRMAGLFTQQAVDVDGTTLLYDHRKRLGQGTLNGLVRFLSLTLDLLPRNETPSK